MDYEIWRAKIAEQRQQIEAVIDGIDVS